MLDGTRWRAYILVMGSKGLTSNRRDTMTTTEARANIAAAANLNSLLQALRETRSLTSEEQDEINWTDLQTFGGDEPDSALGVWSWDAEGLLVGTCADDLKIISRAE